MDSLVITIPGKKSMISVLFVVLILFVAFRVLLKCPLDALGELLESFAILICFAYGIFYLLRKIFIAKNINVIDIGIICIYLIPLYSALMSFLQFEQPLMFGILTQRKAFLGLSCIFIYQLIIDGKIAIRDIERGFLIAAWLEIVMNFSFYLLINPKDYLATSYINMNNAKGGVTYGFDVLLMIGASLYYWIKTIKENTLRYFPFILIFIAYIFFIQKGRGLFIALVLTMSIVFFFQAERNKRILGTAFAILLAVLAVTISSVSSSELLGPLSKSYVNILDVLVGNTTGEASADSRIIQVNSVIEYFGDDLSKVFFGSGKLSNQWESGYKGQFEYLYPSDIGVIGIIFVYGILGFFLFKLPYMLVVRLYRKYKKASVHDPFLLMLFYFLAYIFIHSTQTGEDTFDFQKNAIVIVIIYSIMSKNSSDYGNIGHKSSLA